MSELVVGSIAGLAANSYVVDVASGSTLDLSAGAVFPAGNVIQVVRATDTTTRSTTSTSFVDASIEVSITPKSASSNLILLWSYTAYSVNTGSNVDMGIGTSITDSSNVALSGAEDSWSYFRLDSGDPRTAVQQQTLIGYVAAGSTSARTYKGRFKLLGQASSVTLQNAGYTTGQLFAIEVQG